MGIVRPLRTSKHWHLSLSKLRIAFLGLILAALACAIVRLPRGVETSLYALVGGDSLLISLAEKTSNIIRVACTTPEQEAACRACFNFDSPLDLEAFLEAVRKKGKGLLTAKSRALLEKDDLARIRRSTLRRDYASVGLFSKEDDPYYFLHDFVMSLKNLKPTQDGIVLTSEVDVRDAATVAGLRALLDLAAREEGIYLSGAPFHTLVATEQTKDEINVLGTISLLAVFVCGWLLFRTIRFALPTALALASGFLGGTAAVCLLPGQPHAMTFLFGTTLVGLGVDYCYHALAEQAEAAFVKNLTQALASTVLAFTPLLFSSAGVLREMALFTIAGLLTIYAFVLLFMKQLPGWQVPPPGMNTTLRRTARIVFLVGIVVLTGLAGWRGFDFNNDPTQFHRMTPLLVRGEAKFTELLGETTDQLVLVPLQDWQTLNAQQKAKLGDVKGDFLTAADLPSWLTVEDFILLPRDLAGEGYRAVNPKGELTHLFTALANETYLLLGVALVGFVFFIKKVWTALAAVACTVITLAAFGQSINFFQVMSFFILIGLGIDYAVFPGGRVVFYSFLTSLIGFGMLGLTTFPVTQGMGLTLAIGLFYAYLLACLGRRTAPVAPAHTTAHWAAQKEQSAGKGRLLLMWYFYRFLGKHVAKLLFLPGYLFIYPFCKPGRAALRQYYQVAGIKPRPFRQILAFAWSLLDKIDACALCKNPPHFTVTDDTDWMKGGAFLLSTHIGCIEVLPALRKTYPQAPRVHAFQQMGHNALYTELFAKKLDPAQLTLHAVEEIGVETAVEMQAAIRRGELVLMAGDRVSAGSNRNLTRAFLGRDCQWPKGVFRFAKLMESPVYGIVCAQTGWNAYEVSAKRLDADDLLTSYISFLTTEIRRFPYQWYQFYRFFPDGCPRDGR